MVNNTQQNNMTNTDKKPKKPKGKKVLNLATILIMIGALIAGIFFSSSFFLDNYKLGSDFRGYYSALVAVDDVSAEAEPSQNNQPNGNAREAAGVLEQRLNPMGTSQIIVETAGANYLKVLSPVEAYNSETEFRNQIQRNGGAIILDGDLRDLQFNGDERKGINDFFSSARATSITSNVGKNPAIQFDLNGDSFSSLFGEDSSSLNASIMIDADGLYNDIRNWYALVPRNTLRARIEDFFDNVIQPMRVSYNAATEEQRRVIDDLFIGRYLDRTTGNVEQFRFVNVLDIGNDRTSFVDNFTNYVNNGFEYIADTSKYVYDPNATTDDFSEGGKYSQIINGTRVTAAGGSNQIELGVIRDVFENINTFMVSFVKERFSSWTVANTGMESTIQSYFLMDGVITTSSSTASGMVIQANSFISGNQLIIEYSNQPESKARIGAAIFNASTRGFVFTVNNISTIDASITKTMVWIAATFLVAFLIAVLIYALITYRLMGMFMILIVGAIIMFTLLASTWFSLTLGAEAIFAVTIIAAINLEIFSIIFEQAKYNIFLKQRNIRVSFSIAVKESYTLAVDILVALIIPAISMFWISTNAIQSFAIMILMGVAFSFLLSLLFALLLFKLIIATNVFEKNPNTFALNTNFTSDGSVLLNYKIRILTNKKEKLLMGENPDKDKISNYDKKIEILEEKLKIRKEKVGLNAKKFEEKYTIKLNKKIEWLNAKKKKNPKKALKYELKIEELNYIIKDDTDAILDAESEITLSTNDKVKTNQVEKQIKRSSKIFATILTFLAVLATAIGNIFGPNYDNTFGNRIEYTIWGTQLEQVFTALQNIPSRQDIDDREFIDAVDQLISEETGGDDVQIEFVVASFLELLFSRPDVVNQLAQTTGTNRLFRSHNFTVSHGETFIFESGATTDDARPWITLAVMTTNPVQSNIVRRVFQNVGGLDRNQAISTSGGFISKQIRPYTAIAMAVQIAWTLLALILGLAIYILIRFKWTYYVAMVIGIVFVPAITLAATIGFHLSFGIGTLIAIAISIILMISTMMMVFGKARALIATKDEKSLKQFFKEEISLSSNLKNKRRSIKDELYARKVDMKVALKADGLTKEEKVNIKNEFKKSRHEKWLGFKTDKRETRIQINRVSRKNNYLKEVMVQTFKFGLKRAILVGMFFVTFGVLFSIAFTPIASIGIAVIAGTVGSMVVMLLICLPLWVILEQVRIRNHLTRKHFINGLKVSREEQIIEGIND